VMRGPFQSKMPASRPNGSPLRKLLGWGETNEGHKGYGGRGAEVQALVEKKGARKRECPKGQAKAGRKQGEARLLI
jgi:hypothetical protein